MHVRFSTSLGLPVIEKDSREVLGIISGILIHPDTGKVEGFYVRVAAVFGSAELYVSSLDILRWGTAVEVRSHEALSPAEERIRLQSLLEDGREILGQRIRTESGAELGRCRDIQFDTEKMRVTWLFPRKWWRWGVAIPIGEVVEVKRECVIVRDPAVPRAEKQTLDPMKTLERLQEIADPGIAKPSRNMR